MAEQSYPLAPILVIGAGAWGSALAVAIATNGHQVLLWGRDAMQIIEMQATGANEAYLPGVTFPENLTVSADLEPAIVAAKHILIAVPSTAFVGILNKINPIITDDMSVSWATKGFTPETGQFLYDTAQELLGEAHPLAIISGPSFAIEVAKNLPTAVTVAAADESFAKIVAAMLHSLTLRVYTTNDLIGVQLGGTIKNVMAIAAGIADGLGYGANTRAALITRAMAEIVRLATSLGAQTETLFGLSGIGDLILTCTDNQSRNRQLGLAIGRGLSVDQAIAEIGKTVEGVHAARMVLERAQQNGLDMPIVGQVCNILFHGYQPRQAVQKLLERDQKAEMCALEIE